MQTKAREAEKQYGIDLSQIDSDELTQGERDVLHVFEADLHDSRKEPAPLIVGLMHYIQEKYA